MFWKHNNFSLDLISWERIVEKFLFFRLRHPPKHSTQFYHRFLCVLLPLFNQGYFFFLGCLWKRLVYMTIINRPTDSCNFVSLWKIYSCQERMKLSCSCLFIPNCTRIHVITYTKCDISVCFFQFKKLNFSNDLIHPLANSLFFLFVHQSDIYFLSCHLIWPQLYSILWT